MVRQTKRQKSVDSDKMTDIIALRVTPNEKKQLKQMANNLGMTISGMIWKCVHIGVKVEQDRRDKINKLGLGEC